MNEKNETDGVRTPEELEAERLKKYVWVQPPKPGQRVPPPPKYPETRVSPEVSLYEPVEIPELLDVGRFSSKDFTTVYADRHPMTVIHWNSLMEEPRDGAPMEPVVNVNWYDAVRACNARSRAEGLEPVYDEETWEGDFSKNGWRLPTPKEWETAAKGGGTEVLYGPADETVVYNREKICDVGTMKPNPFGIYDLVGLVWKWCEDEKE